MSVCRSMTKSTPIVLVVVSLFVGATQALAQWQPSPDGHSLYLNGAFTYVGIGTDSPAPYSLKVTNAGNAFFGVQSTSALAGFIMDRGSSTASSSLNFRSQGADKWIMGIGVYTGYDSSHFVLGDQAAPKLIMDATGAVGIGTAPSAAKLEVNGDLHASGTITGGMIHAKYQDVAEWVPSIGDLGPGKVVILSGTRDNAVIASSTAYDTHVAGVVSPQPGITLGEAGDGKSLIATTGRVRVRVSACNGPIQRGDLLVTSPQPGTAMRSTPIRVANAEIHRPGTVLGKALEPLDHGEGNILVLLTLQ